MKKIISKLPREIFSSLKCVLAFGALIYFLVLGPAVALCETVTLAWDANNEPDLMGYTLSYGTASGNYTSDIDVGNTTQYTTPDLQGGITYYFAVKAYNEAGLESGFSNEVSHTVINPNENPQADAGLDQSVTEGDVTTLNGGSSSDPDGRIVSYLWEQIDGAAVQLSNAGSQQATFVAPAAGNLGDRLTFRITVTDDGGLTDSDTCIVDVSPRVVIDSDGDGVPDHQDDFPYNADEYLDTDGDGEGNNADTDDDNDGMPDDWELSYGLDPLVDDAAGDPDGDGVSNINEFNLGTAPNYSEGNFKPDTPALLMPENGASVSLTPQFETGDFNDPNVNDEHSQTQWVVIRAFDDVCVFDVTSTASLTSLTLPKHILEEDTEYIWKARFIDTHDTPSDWSAEREFLTGFADDDADKNGVPDVQEVAVTLDLDQDGTADRIQPDIRCASAQDGDGDVQICVSIKDAENAQSIVSLEVQDPADPNLISAIEGKPNYFEFGLLGFKLLVTNPGDETTVTIYLSKPAFTEGNCFKYDPVDGIWLDYSGFTNFSPNRQEVYLTLRDGGFGDADGIANGIIVDPLAFGSESDPSGGSSGSPIDDVVDGIVPDDLSCFISTAAARADARQSWSLWHEIRGRELSIIFILILVGVLAKVIFAGTRRKGNVLH